MSTAQQDEPDRLEGFPHPREASALFGHQGAQAAMLDGLKGGRLHHAWLIGGPEGIGKATFAYSHGPSISGVHCGAARATGMPFWRGRASIPVVAHWRIPISSCLRGSSSPEPALSQPRSRSTTRAGLDMFAIHRRARAGGACASWTAPMTSNSRAQCAAQVIEEPAAAAIFPS